MHISIPSIVILRTERFSFLQGASLRAISLDAESFKIPAAPDLIPDGEWVKVPGGNITTAKGFKATGAHCACIHAWAPCVPACMVHSRGSSPERSSR